MKQERTCIGGDEIDEEDAVVCEEVGDEAVDAFAKHLAVRGAREHPLLVDEAQIAHDEVPAFVGEQELPEPEDDRREREHEQDREPEPDQDEDLLGEHVDREHTCAHIPTGSFATLLRVMIPCLEVYSEPNVE